MKTMESNFWVIYGFQSIGVGHTSLTKLCNFLTMPPPMNKNEYDCQSYSIKVASKHVAERSMSDAAPRLRGIKTTADVGVSRDATWKGKRFSSTFAVMTVGRLDVAVLSKS